jgi:nucleotidyltransferase AbiEii toxin of type IV toxin-antitoxin system
MDKADYFDRLYPLQDEALKVLREVETGLYLTGGTAASRGYLHHRFSDDLDLFANDSPEFLLWTERLIKGLSARGDWSLQILLREQRFVRLNVASGTTQLKIEMVNDVPARVGEITMHPVFGRLDSAENILANKVSALIDREEPKDFADIWGFCSRLGMPLAAALEGAQSKAAGIFPADVARLLCTAELSDWKLVRWIEAPDAERYLANLRQLGEELILP